MAKGWFDYLAPQLYWPINQTPQAFKVLHDYWIGQNFNGVRSGLAYIPVALITARNPGLPKKF
jgi:uncharacterized lipoprotein YddW (UPF0748 family)